MAINLRAWSQTAAQRGWGPGWPSCGGVKAAGTAVVTARLSGTRMSWHKRIAVLAGLLMNETERRGFLLKPAQCGAYNCRAISGTHTSSNHAWALAGDLNWNDNPFTTSGKHTIPDWVRELWARYGFANGAMYSGAKDWMHHEFMGTPADADAMTALALHELGGVAVLPPVPATPAIEWIDLEAQMDVPVLRKGDGVKGAPGGRGVLRWYVLRLQACLGVSGLAAKAPLSGEFDAATVAALQELQARNHITADGVCGAKTWPFVLGNLAPDFA